MNLTISQILKAVEGTAATPLRDSLGLGNISTDSRQLGKNDVFFALGGPNFDGHDFIDAAISKGARHFVVSNPAKFPKNSKTEVNLIVVPDVLKAYGNLAAFFRGQFHVPAVAITGSSGKTTVKELAAQALSSRFSVLKNHGTENNLVGVPKTILQLESSHEIMVLEMGTNQPGEISRLSSIISPQAAVLTLIGPSHLEKLKDIEGVRKEKMGVVANVERGGTLFVNGEDARLVDVQSGSHRVVRVGLTKDGNDYFADNIWCHETGTSFQLNGKEVFETSLIGRHNIINSLLAIAVALTFGAPMEDIRRSLKEFKPVSGRLNLKNIEDVIFIDDSYNSNPVSFRAALETLKSFKTRGKKGVVFGDMLELGSQAEAFHREAGSLLSQLMFDFVIATGPLANFAAQEALKNGVNSSSVYMASDSAEAGKICRGLVAAGDMVLVKGSRAMKMEKVFEYFKMEAV